ncbi:zinc-finger domain-containing protein [Facilibium subflavum]|uniref:zinc-finger domain-containing protein n=1 Tax=Facilibium subflavum TaxID=2219058 RepID=UPI000E655791|nr:zinc-finger domain-containing protein [Facilibium subflavum]
MATQKNIQTITVKKGQRICCPLPEHASWNKHPRVYINLEDKNEGICPYCSTRFVIEGLAPTDSDA